MIEKVDYLQKTRKKPPQSSISKQNQPIISTPNLKYHFLTSEPGKVLYDLRRTQIDTIVDNLRNYIKFNNTNSEQLSKQKPIKYKKITITAGKPGTGKTSSIKYALDLLIQQCKKSSKQYKLIQSIRVLEFNANSLRKCNQINKQIKKLDDLKQSQRIRSIVYMINKQSEMRLNVLYIEEIDKFIESNNQNDLQQFLQKLSNKQSSSQKQTKMDINNRYLLIGASNCINIQHLLLKKLPISSTSSLSSSSSSKPQIIIYQPYSQQSIIKILTNKIQMVKQKLDINLIINQKLLRYIGMKLNQNRKDDARTIIQVVKELLVYAQNRNKQHKINNNIQCRQQNSNRYDKIDKIDKRQKIDNQMIDDKTQTQSLLTLTNKYDEHNIQITLQTINKHTKIKDMIINPKIQIMQKLTIKQHLMLLCIYQYMKQYDSIQVPYMELIEKYKKLHIIMGISSNYQDAGNAIRELETYDCIQIRNNRNKSNGRSGGNGGNMYGGISVGKAGNKVKCNMKIVLKVSLTDIQKVLGRNVLLSKYF